MRLRISHSTTYRYEGPVPYAVQQVRLTPKSSAGQKVLHWDMTIDGGREELRFDDHNNNQVTLISLAPGGQEIMITCQGDVDTADNAGITGRHGGFAPLWFFGRSTGRTEAGSGVRRLVRELGSAFDGDVSRLHALAGLVGGRIAYETGMTHPETTAEEALAAGHGVCQDHAHVFIAAARLMGYPARYVSGYLLMDDRTRQDAGHAWAEAHLDGVGWVGFDVSNGISPDERYVRVATGLDYADAAPVSGMRFGEGVESMIVSLQVQQ